MKNPKKRTIPMHDEVEIKPVPQPRNIEELGKLIAFRANVALSIDTEPDPTKRSRMHELFKRGKLLIVRLIRRPIMPVSFGDAMRAAKLEKAEKLIIVPPKEQDRK